MKILYNRNLFTPDHGKQFGTRKTIASISIAMKKCYLNIKSSLKV